MTHGGQFSVEPMRGCFAGGCWLACPDGTQDAQETVGLSQFVVERKHVQGLGQGSAVTAGYLDGDWVVGVKIEIRGRAEAGEQGVNGALLEFTAVVTPPSDDLFGGPAGQFLASRVEPTDDAIGVEHEDRGP